MKWRNVVGHPGYQVSDEGQVRSFKNPGKPSRLIVPKILRLNNHANGYKAVNLWNNGIPVTKKVHRLVLEAFVGPCPLGMEACHNDGDPSNNHLSNLRWDTKVANWEDRRRHSL